jgi:hypothetical protein
MVVIREVEISWSAKDRKARRDDEPVNLHHSLI